ncbi:hypothetical protein BC831DRAFT_421506 [Entophlyctis helioformis]|nr:hypothetical protein BC831DRAFT_421506 [Entophlyctis helioformis]
MLTGQGIVLIPHVYQISGWFVPTLSLIGIGILTGFASLFCIEATSKFPGNERFERNIEFTVLVHQFYGKKWLYIMFFFLYGSLTSTNVTAIVGSAQVFDNLLISILGETCGIGLAPISGFYCVKEAGTGSSPFGHNFMAFTLGYLINFMVIVPLTMVDLNSNVLFQLVSTGYVGLFVITVVYMSMVTGLDSSRLPAINYDQSHVLGTVLLNYVLSNAVLSWVNVSHSKVNIKKAVWSSIAIVCVSYIIIGIFGALAFKTTLSTNILQVMYTNDVLGPLGQTWMKLVYVLYPFMINISSVPVTMIIIRLNLMAARFGTKERADFFATYAPFLISIPFQTGSIFNIFSIWTSLTFQSACNFIAPFLIFFFLYKRNTLLGQSMMDDLEFLDINAGLKKTYRDDDDDDFDYIYHLPFADPERIIRRDPFKKTEEQLNKKKSMSQLSLASRHSIKAIRGMLDPSIGELPAAYKKTVNNSRLSLRASSNQLAKSTSMMIGSNANLGTAFGGSQLGGMSTRTSKASDKHRAVLNMYGGGGLTVGSGGGSGHRGYRSGYIGQSGNARSGQVEPVDTDLDDYGGKDADYAGAVDTYNVAPPFRAIPKWLTVFVRAQWLAGLCALLMTILVLDVIIVNLTNPEKDE